MWTASAVCALAFAAIGCGDDDDTAGGDSGVADGGGIGGAGGKGGKGGAGGAGGAPSKAQCVSETSAILQGNSDGPSAECISCACTEAPGPVTACNAEAEKCWGLIECVTFNCLMASDLASCVTEKCSTLTAGILKATPLQGVLQGAACRAKCEPDLDDAGTPDGG